MSRKSSEIYRLIRDIMDLEDKLKQMSDDWNSDDECAAACSDPGLQYEVEEDLEDRWEELKSIIQNDF